MASRVGGTHEKRDTRSRPVVGLLRRDRTLVAVCLPPTPPNSLMQMVGRPGPPILSGSAASAIH